MDKVVMPFPETNYFLETSNYDRLYEIYNGNNSELSRYRVLQLMSFESIPLETKKNLTLLFVSVLPSDIIPNERHFILENIDPTLEEKEIAAKEKKEEQEHRSLRKKGIEILRKNGMYPLTGTQEISKTKETERLEKLQNEMMFEKIQLLIEKEFEKQITTQRKYRYEKVFEAINKFQEIYEKFGYTGWKQYKYCFEKKGMLFWPEPKFKEEDFNTFLKKYVHLMVDCTIFSMIPIEIKIEFKNACDYRKEQLKQNDVINFVIQKHPSLKNSSWAFDIPSFETARVFFIENLLNKRHATNSIWRKEITELGKRLSSKCKLDWSGRDLKTAHDVEKLQKENNFTTEANEILQCLKIYNKIARVGLTNFDLQWMEFESWSPKIDYDCLSLFELEKCVKHILYVLKKLNIPTLEVEKCTLELALKESSRWSVQAKRVLFVRALRSFWNLIFLHSDVCYEIEFCMGNSNLKHIPLFDFIFIPHGFNFLLKTIKEKFDVAGVQWGLKHGDLVAILSDPISQPYRLDEIIENKVMEKTQNIEKISSDLSSFQKKIQPIQRNEGVVEENEKEKKKEKVANYESKKEEPTVQIVEENINNEGQSSRRPNLRKRKSSQMLQNTNDRMCKRKKDKI